MYLKVPSDLTQENIFKEIVEKSYYKRRNRNFKLKDIYPNIKEQVEFHLSTKLPGHNKFYFLENDGCLPVEVEFRDNTEELGVEKLRELRYFWNEKQWSINPSGMSYEEFCKKVEENFIMDIDTCVLYSTGR